MTKTELFERHKQQMCKNCTKGQNCDGIYIRINNTTACEEGEVDKVDEKV